MAPAKVLIILTGLFSLMHNLLWLVVSFLTMYHLRR